MPSKLEEFDFSFIISTNTILVNSTVGKPDDHPINWCIQKKRFANSRCSGSISNGRITGHCTSNAHWWVYRYHVTSQSNIIQVCYKGSVVLSMDSYIYIYEFRYTMVHLGVKQSSQLKIIVFDDNNNIESIALDEEKTDWFHHTTVKFFYVGK